MKSMKVRILLVEDDESLRKFLAEELKSNQYTVLETGTLAHGIEVFKGELPDIILTDLKLPDGRGDQFLEIVRDLPFPPPVLLMTAFGQVDEAVTALKGGAADFLTKPLDVDHLLLCLDRTKEVQNLRRQVHELQRQPPQRKEVNDSLRLGTSPVWKQIERQLPKIAMTDDPVLITGPSGSGKEVVARAIHNLSSRQAFPFIPINCSGLSENLLESELFGHDAGAFTGANKARKGLFLTAEGGTLLLDEIGDMPIEMQTKLLRALQEKKIRPLGSDHEKPVNIRILASTNRVLEDQIKEGAFREDLYYRLETFYLKLPPLRERPDDIELFVSHFISESSQELGKNVEGVSEEALQCLKAYDFPGNVRELKNTIRRAVAFSSLSMIQVEDLPEKLRKPTASLPGSWPVPSKLQTLDTMKRNYASHVVAACGGNKQKSARILGISRQTLYALLANPE